MELKEAITKRRSVRNFHSDPVTDEIIKELVSYANLAPSAGNLQARDFIIIKDKSVKNDVAKACYNQSFVAEAPVVIVVCANLDRIRRYGQRGTNLYIYHDTGAAIENLMLVALEFGLGTCWVGAFDENKVSKILSLPAHIVPVAVVPVGKPREYPEPRKRLPMSQIYHNGKF